MLILPWALEVYRVAQTQAVVASDEQSQGVMLVHVYRVQDDPPRPLTTDLSSRRP